MTTAGLWYLSGPGPMTTVRLWSIRRISVVGRGVSAYSGAGAAVGQVNSRNDPAMDATRPNPLYLGADNATSFRYPLYALSEVFVVVDPAAITGVAITSDPGNDQSYATGDEIELALSFGEAVAVGGHPRIRLRLGETASTASTERWAEHDGGALIKNTAQIPFSGRALNASSPRLAQGFRTGVGETGYTLSAIGVRFHTIDNPATAAAQLSVSLHADAGGNPGAALCTLSDPASFGSNALNTFGAPDPCPALAPQTAYYVVIERVGFSAADTIALWDTASAGEDGGGARGWSIRNSGHAFTPQRPILERRRGALADQGQRPQRRHGAATRAAQAAGQKHRAGHKRLRRCNSGRPQACPGIHHRRQRTRLQAELNRRGLRSCRRRLDSRRPAGRHAARGQQRLPRR